MARPKKQVVQEVDGNSINTVEKRDVGMSLTKDRLTGEWVVVRIRYDLETGEVSPPEEVVRELDRGVAQERFKIVIAQELFV